MVKDEAREIAAFAGDADLLGPEAQTWIDRLTPQRDRLADAVRVLADEGELHAAADLAARTWRLWLTSGDIDSGREFLAPVVAAADGPPSRGYALALYADGLLAFRQGAQDESRARNEEALAAARSVGDREAESLALVGLSRVAFREGDYERVQSLAREAHALVRDLPPAATIAPLHLLAAGTRLAGDLDGAVAFYEENLAIARELGDKRMVAIELHNIGHVELHRGNVATAERCFAEAAELRDRGDPYDAAMTQLNAASLAYARGESARAKELATAVDAAGLTLDPDDAFELDWLRERVL